MPALKIPFPSATAVCTLVYRQEVASKPVLRAAALSYVCTRQLLPQAEPVSPHSLTVPDPSPEPCPGTKVPLCMAVIVSTGYSGFSLWQ